MYANVLIASWLKATNGLRESMRELVPSRKVPPSFVVELEAAAAKPPSATAAVTSAAVLRHRLLILLSLGITPKGWLVHVERAAVGSERTPHPEREGSEMLAVPEGQL